MEIIKNIPTKAGAFSIYNDNEKQYMCPYFFSKFLNAYNLTEKYYFDFDF